MTKFGTPVGAGPKFAIVRLGLELVGTPLAVRSGVSGIGLDASSGLRRTWPRREGARPPWRSDVEVCLLPVPWPPPPTWPPLPPVVPLPGPPPTVPPPLDRPPVVVVEGVVVVVFPPLVVVLPPDAEPLVPDSVVSSGPEQSGSARSVTPSPSLSLRSEHCGRVPTGGSSEPPGRLT